MTDNLLDAFAASVARNGRRTAIVEKDGKSTSFGQLAARSKALAFEWATRGMGPGDRILIAQPVGADLYASLAAIWSVGAIAVLPEPAMGLAGLRHAIRAADVTGFCTSGIYGFLRFVLPALWSLPVYRTRVGRLNVVPLTPANSSDTALISFTSGTTGAPKAIPRSHAFLSAQQQAVSPLLASNKTEVDLVAFPVFVLINLAEGRTSVLPNWKMSGMERLAPEALAKWIAVQGVTRLLLPPSLCEKLADVPIPLAVHTLFTGGGPVFPDLVVRLKARAPEMRIVSVYGSTEAEPIAELDMADVSKEDQAAMASGGGLLAGTPVKDVRIQIKEGEILVSGDHVNKGYLDPVQNGETKITEDNLTWHRTGDAGYLDEKGRLWLLGRWGGAVQTSIGLVHPFALETAARMWPRVRRAALVNLDDKAVLAIEGDETAKEVWQREAKNFGIGDIRIVSAMPMDRRHRSKVDLRALRRMLER